MNALEAALLIAALVLPFHLLVRWQLGLLSNPRYLRNRGVVILHERVLEGTSAVIGHYRGREIFGSVTFMGMEYRFDRVVPRSYRGRVGARELYLEPGLVYVTD